MGCTDFSGIWDANRSPNYGQTKRPSVDQQKKKKKKKPCRIENFAVTFDHRVEPKQSKKRDKYLDLARELKKNGV